ncbi:MAG TPA: hypothetical protein DIT01_13555 [Lentisphaeria bacterium]|mgnify:CR=1 FL=1|nr:hypothetical protein [Lentisphaeria bacterium]|tara:strand:- start:2013 stop:3251 length:1239 start_codon:yes stop_codon:yes gene_type:complete
MKVLKLTVEEATDAAAVQAAIDRVAALGGGRVALPEMTVTLDRGIELRSDVELTGQGKMTVLRKGPGRMYPLSGYHNYGMCDVPLQTVDGLKVGMTVSVEDNLRGGFYGTFARITWIDGCWVGLDHGIEMDYTADQSPVLATVFPLVFGHGIANAAVRDLTLDGRLADQPKPMNGCRGAAVYFARSRDIEISGVQVSDYHGEGIGWQMCRDVRVLDSVVNGSSGNGIHPGAGSTNCLVRGCSAADNRQSGFFFCVRANRITVAGCRFTNNDIGISIGARDCHNLIEDCEITQNRGPGVLLRETPEPIAVHDCEVRNCTVTANATVHGDGQIVVPADAHDIAITANHIQGTPSRPGPGVSADAGTARLHLAGNKFVDCRPEIAAPDGVLVDAAASIECGYGTGADTAYRHLST